MKIKKQITKYTISEFSNLSGTLYYTEIFNTMDEADERYYSILKNFSNVDEKDFTVEGVLNIAAHRQALDEYYENSGDVYLTITEHTFEEEIEVDTNAQQDDASILIRWAIEDIKMVDDSLSDDECTEILAAALDDHDATIGITWDVLLYHVDEYLKANLEDEEVIKHEGIENEKREIGL